ncbi:Mpv17-like protein [Klebsormidium nitens]|uniref:Mpv17-like protein n=1 Tax=Klebsormidium nitens TaxID=105231 RepID=A0A1Y1HSP1_KLENI|nr:Mpv17-like protein [Klebsormidium nitens]|eukprot:GAQ78838.1 Mpv17-like protein [Klebsormidium nitens]
MSHAAPLQRLIGSLRSLARRPELRAGATSGVIMGVGDVICQTMQKTSQKPKVLTTEASSSPPSSDSELRRGSGFSRDHLQAQTDTDPQPNSNSVEQLWLSFVQDLDFQRTLRFAFVGLTLHGPYFLHGFRWLDATFGPSKSLQIAVAKTALGQAVVFPVYLGAFFTYMGKLEGKTWQECKVKLEQGFLPTYTSGCVFWPVANMFNFTMVPPTERVLYSNIVGLVWNSYLSYANSKVTQLRLLENEELPLRPGS